MNTLFIPKEYSPLLSQRETQRAIKVIKDTFQKKLAKALNLDRVTAPIFVTKESGLNDDLNGVERKVDFTIKKMDEKYVEVVQSLAKWKRMALHKYGYEAGEGIYTDMNAIRRDDDVDNMHSVFVDQWDWEKVISPKERNVEYLKETVRAIVNAIVDTKIALDEAFPQVTFTLNREVKFITTQELEDEYPLLSAKERENAVVKKYGTVFIMKIGDKLKSGKKHDGRAPDYDDWTLNGDIIVYYPLLDIALELSSMGIRVDEEAMLRQLTIANCLDRKELPFHKALLDGKLPYTVGGGIGQSRLCMFFLRKAHIGEVQASYWPADTVRTCAAKGITLL